MLCEALLLHTVRIRAASSARRAACAALQMVRACVNVRRWSSHLLSGEMWLWLLCSGCFYLQSIFVQLAEAERVVIRPAATSWRARDLLGRVRCFFVFASISQAASSSFKSSHKLAPRASPEATSPRSAAPASTVTARRSRRFKSVRRRIAQTPKKAFQGQQLFKHSGPPSRGPNITARE